MMSLHTARVAPEKLISHQPAAVQFSGISKGIDMNMHQIEVSIIDGDILVSQDSPNGDDQSSILITPEQAELVCAWIMNAARSMKAED